MHRRPRSAVYPLVPQTLFRKVGIAMKRNQLLLAATILCLGVCATSRTAHAVSEGRMEVGVSAQSSLSPPLRSLVAPVAVLGAAEQNADLLEGTYDVTASAHGYTSSTQTAVAVTNGGTTTVDFVLTPIPDVTVRGTVTDGSGWGIPLYARIDISGYTPGPVYTDPLTGEYSVDLPEEAVHTFTVSAVSVGYDTVVRGVTAPAGRGIEDFHLTV